MKEPWSIQLFGGLRAKQADRLITRFRTQKTGVLLAYLAYYGHRSHPREILINMLWPDATRETGRHNLCMALSSLRFQLEPPEVPAGSVLIADRLTIEMNPAAFTADTETFEQALRAAAQSQTDAERIPRLIQAVETCRDRLLPAYYEDWILAEQQRLADRCTDAASQLSALLEKTGERSRAIEYARRAVSADPLQEALHRQLMRLLLAAGQPAEALHQYRQLTDMLTRELAEEPSAATRQLAQQITEQLSSLDVSAPLVVSSPDTSRKSRTQTVSLPMGTVTFLLTDIEGSTALWERAGEAFRSALATHHALLRREFQRAGGQEVQEAGDSFLVAFSAPSDALACAVAGQRALQSQPWPSTIGSLLVRMALYTGEVELEEGEYHGLTLHRASRLLSAAHGGQILCSEATSALLRRELEPGMHLKDLGLYRLRDVEIPERLFEVQDAHSARKDFPAPAADRMHAASLPLSFTRFFGRQTELEQIEAILLTEGNRLLTLTGPGGTGKTRLAIEAGRRLSLPLEGAVWFVSLGNLTDGQHTIEAIREAVCPVPAAGSDAMEQVLAALSQGPALLILDNFEQIVETGASLLYRLMEQSPRLLCLVTSRQILGLPGEQEFALSPLPTPNGRPSAEHLGLYDSVRLFVDRAQAVKPDFRVTNGNAPAVAELCDRLEGIPLAIELAAARAQVLTPAQMLSQLGNRFDFLVSHKRGIVERQRTLRAAVDWSFQLLSPQLQRFFAELSVFRGGWSVEAAEAVCAEPLALDYLAQLREASLLLTEESHLEIRFRMLETLREYASEHLSSEKRVEGAQKHADYFLSLGEEAESKLHTPEQVFWLDRLESEHDNLRAAIEWCKVHLENTELGLRLVGTLGWFWSKHGHLREGREHLTQMLMRTEELGQIPECAKALHKAAGLAEGQADIAAAQTFYEASLAAYRELKDRANVALLLLETGNLATSVGDMSRARSLHSEALAVAREAGITRYIAWSLNNLGVDARAEGDYAQARIMFEELLAIHQELKNPVGIASQLLNLGLTAKVQGDYAVAQSLYEQSLAIYQDAGDEQGIAELLRYLGNAAIDQGNYAEARSHFAESLAIEQKFGDRRQVADLLNRQGRAADHLGDSTEARSLYEQSLTISQEAGCKREIAEALLGLGSLARKQGDYKTAHACYREHLMISQESGDKWNLSHALGSFMRLAAAQGQGERTAYLWGAVEALREAFGIPLSPVERADYERDIVPARVKLGEEAFAAAWAEGEKMTLEQAAEYALNDTEDH